MHLFLGWIVEFAHFTGIQQVKMGGTGYCSQPLEEMTWASTNSGVNFHFWKALLAFGKLGWLSPARCTDKFHVLISVEIIPSINKEINYLWRESSHLNLVIYKSDV